MIIENTLSFEAQGCFGRIPLRHKIFLACSINQRAKQGNVIQLGAVVSDTTTDDRFPVEIGIGTQPLCLGACTAPPGSQKPDQGQGYKVIVLGRSCPENLLVSMNSVSSDTFGVHLLCRPKKHCHQAVQGVGADIKLTDE